MPAPSWRSPSLVFLAVVGLFASVQLWRLRESGRKAAIGMCLVGLAFVFFQFTSLRAFDLVRLAVTALVMGVLVSPPAKRACVP